MKGDEMKNPRRVSREQGERLIKFRRNRASKVRELQRERSRVRCELVAARAALLSAREAGNEPMIEDLKRVVSDLDIEFGAVLHQIVIA